MGHVTAGLMNKQVAGLIGLSEFIVKIHRGNMMRKMGGQDARRSRSQGGGPWHLPNPRK